MIISPGGRKLFIEIKCWMYIADTERIDCCVNRRILMCCCLSSSTLSSLHLVNAVVEPDPFNRQTHTHTFTIHVYIYIDGIFARSPDGCVCVYNIQQFFMAYCSCAINVFVKLFYFEMLSLSLFAVLCSFFVGFVTFAFVCYFFVLYAL